MSVSGSFTIPDWLFVCLLVAWVVVVAIRQALRRPSHDHAYACHRRDVRDDRLAHYA